MILAAPLHAAFLVSLLVHLATQGIAGFVPLGMWGWFSIGILVSGYSGALAIVASGLIRQRATHLLAVQLLLPFYWMLHAAAAARAAIELIRRPDHWAKTTHGVTRLARGPQAPRLATQLPADFTHLVAELERVKGIELGS